MDSGRSEFERCLDVICDRLTREARNIGFKNSGQFEDRVRQLAYEICPKGLGIDPNPKAQIFPDVPAGEYGIEVKYTEANSWRCIGNSIFEGHRAPGVEHIYIVYGKMGGKPEARWGRYEDCICHVRTSHVPRFEIDLEERKSLFDQIGISYNEFALLSEEEKMPFVRNYARSRLKDGEHLWWLETLDSEDSRTTPLAVRLYMALDAQEKRQMRAEAALLCPEINGSSRNRKKYGNVSLFLLAYHGIAAHQARDMFTAGSASHDGTCEDEALNGNYLACALYDIQPEMLAAASYLPDELFVEYWGEGCDPQHRIERWLERADMYAGQNTTAPWVPSEHLHFDCEPIYPPDYSEPRIEHVVVELDDD